MRTLMQDLRFACRMLGKKPGYTTVVVLTLALGIGANTAVFSVINGVFLRPLGYSEPERLVQFRMNGFTTSMVSVPNFLDWREQCSSFTDMGVYRRSSCNFSGHDRPERLSTVVASAGVLPVLGFDAHVGRAFGPEAEKAGEHLVVLLSESFWRRRFGSDSNIVQQSILLNDAPFTVLGVLPRELERAWGRFDVWVPFLLDGVSYERGNHGHQAIGRIKPGVSVAAARAELRAVSTRIGEVHPNGNRNNSGGIRTAEFVRFVDARVGEHGKALLLLLSAAVGLVLLIVCANVANLLLAKSSTRRKEFAVRAALGAGRRRLVRQVITECLLLALAGGAMGALMASWGVDLLDTAFPNQLSQGHEMASDQTPRTSYEVGIDHRVLLVTLALSLLTSVLFGLAPAFRSARISLSEALKEGAGAVSPGKSRVHLGDWGLVGQIALTLALAICAGLLVKSFHALRAVEPGFAREQLLTLRLGLGNKNYRHPEQCAAFFEQVTRRVRETPGVIAAGATHALPLCSRGTGNTTTIEDYVPAEYEKFWTRKIVVTPGYFDAMRVSLLDGRDFSAGDSTDGRQVVIVSQNIAERFWPGEVAIGKRLKYGSRDGPNPWLTVVGVVGDVRQYGLDQEAPSLTYRPYAQELWWTARTPMTIAARTSGDPLVVTQAVQSAIWEVDGDIPLYEVCSMDGVVSDSTYDQAALAGLLVVFAAIALLLAAIGLYGLMSHSVSQRTRELGMRIALGAQARDLLRLVMARSAFLTLLGVAGGVGLALLLARLLGTLLYGVSSTDPMTFMVMGLSIVAVGLVASYFPARRATKVDPLVALRCL